MFENQLDIAQWIDTEVGPTSFTLTASNGAVSTFIQTGNLTNITDPTDRDTWILQGFEDITWFKIETEEDITDSEMNSE